MRDHSAARVYVYAFVYVDLSCCGPSWPNHPEGRPGATCQVGQVYEIGNDKALIVGPFAGYMDAGPTLGGDIVVVNAKRVMGYPYMIVFLTRPA